MLPLNYLSSFWSTLEILLINCENNPELKWSENCFWVAGIAANLVPTFISTDSKLHVPVVALSTQDIVRLLKELTFGFKRIIN